MESARLAVVVGIDGYGGGIPRLRNAVRDAQAVSAVLGHHGFRAEDGTLIELLDGDATHDALHELLAKRLPVMVGSSHRVIVYFAGHGHAAPDDERVLRGFLLPVDAVRDDRTRHLGMDLVRDALAGLRCHHLLVMLDCCSAGAFARPIYRDIDGDDHHPLIAARYHAMQRRRAFQLLASASHDERALDSLAAKAAQDARGDHSPFARAVIEALTPPSIVDRDRDGVITASEVYAHVHRRLVAEARDQTPNLWPLAWHDGGEFTFLFGEPRFFVPDALTRGDSPYRGLEPFRERDAAVFFGRRDISQQLAARILDVRLVVVVAPSGAGKTSLLCAGVVPLLRAHASVCGPIRLGGSPLATLAAQLAALLDDGRPIVLIVDPLEELVTMKPHDDERACVLAVLRAAVDAGAVEQRVAAPAWFDPARAEQLALCVRVVDACRARLHIVLAMRSEYEGLFADELASADAWSGARHVVPALHRDGLRDCIELPASGRFLVFSPDAGPLGARLVDALLDEVEQMPGGLPLLSVALDEMFRAYVDSGRGDRTLGWDDYHAIGGAGGALRRRAEEVYAFAEREAVDRAMCQASLRELMLRLIAFENGALARRRVRRSALVFDDARETERTGDVLALLVEARLVIADGDVIELAHDALIHGWPRVVSWIAPARSALLDRVAAATADWRAAPADRKALPLWDDERLLELRALIPGTRLSTRALLAQLPTSTLTRDERAFVAASDLARRRRRTRGRTIVAAVGVSLAAAAGYSQVQRATAEEQRGAVEVQRRRSDQMLAAAYVDRGLQLLVHEGQPLAALPYLAEARTMGSDGPALRLMFARASASVPRMFQLRTGGRVLATWLDDDRLLLGDERALQVWSMRAGQPIASPIGPAAPIDQLAVSPDGGVLLIGAAGEVTRWQPMAAAQLGPPIHVGGQVVTTMFSDDARRAIAVGGELAVWDVGTRSELLRVRAPRIADASLSADGTRVLVMAGKGNDLRLRLWDVARRRPIGSVIEPGLVGNAALSPDGTWLVTVADDGSPEVRDATTGRLRTPRRSAGEPVRTSDHAPADPAQYVDVAITATGHHFVTVARHDARVWSAAGAPLTDPFGGGDVVGADPDRQGYVVVSDDQSGMTTWEATTGAPLAPVFTWPHEVQMVRDLSPGGTGLVAAGASGLVLVWDLTRLLPGRAGMPVAPLPAERTDEAVVRIAPCAERAVISQTEQRSLRIWTRTLEGASPIDAGGDVLACNMAHAVIARADQTVLRSLVAGGAERVLEAGEDLVAAAFDAGDRRLYGLGKSTLRAWDAATGKLDPAFRPIEVERRAVADANVLVGERFDDRTVCFAVAEDRRLVVWSAAAASVVRVFDPDGRARGERSIAGAGEVIQSRLSPRGERLIQVTRHVGAIRVVDVASGAVASFTPDAGVVDVVPSPDGALLAVVAPHVVELWDIASQRQVIPPLPHRGELRDAAFSPDGATLYTSDERGGLFAWPLPHDDRDPAAWSAFVAACVPNGLRDGLLVPKDIDPSACERVRAAARR